MFGKKGKLEKRLAAGQLRRASAFVLKRHYLGGSTGAIAGSDANTGIYRVHVRIEPPGEEPFEASLNYNATHVGLVPHEGGRIPVAYDADDRGDVIWDEQAARDASLKQFSDDRERRDRIRAERREAGLEPIEQTGPDPNVQAKLIELQGRLDRGELTEWEFRVARAEVFKEIGF